MGKKQECSEERKVYGGEGGGWKDKERGSREARREGGWVCDEGGMEKDRRREYQKNETRGRG